MRRRPGRSWYVGETCLKGQGRWCCLYRAIDRHENLIDTTLSQTRDMAAAQTCLRPAEATMGFTPDRVTTDGHGSYPRALRSTTGEKVRHRTSACLDSQQDHRGIGLKSYCLSVADALSV